MTDQTDSPQPKQPKQPKKPKPEDPGELLAYLCERYPNAFTQDAEAVMPLLVGIDKRLAARGFSNAEALKGALALYVNSPAYLAALAAGKPRVDLDGQPVDTVSRPHRAEAAAELAEPGRRQRLELAGRIDKPQQQPKTMAQIELTAAFAKIAFTIDPETFRKALDVDSTGAKTVPVTISVDGKRYTANLNPKSFRKAQQAFRDAAQPTVSISGNLKGGAVESAGIQVFDKAAKDAPADAQ